MDKKNTTTLQAQRLNDLSQTEGVTVTPQQIDALEKQVNERIDAGLPVQTEVMDIEFPAGVL